MNIDRDDLIRRLVEKQRSLIPGDELILDISVAIQALNATPVGAQGLHANWLLEHPNDRALMEEKYLKFARKLLGDETESSKAD